MLFSWVISFLMLALVVWIGGGLVLVFEDLALLSLLYCGWVSWSLDSVRLTSRRSSVSSGNDLLGVFGSANLLFAVISDQWELGVLLGEFFLGNSHPSAESELFVGEFSLVSEFWLCACLDKVEFFIILLECIFGLTCLFWTLADLLVRL